MRGTREAKTGKGVKDEAIKRRLGQIVIYAKEYNSIL